MKQRAKIIELHFRARETLSLETSRCYKFPRYITLPDCSAGQMVLTFDTFFFSAAMYTQCLMDRQKMRTKNVFTLK